MRVTNDLLWKFGQKGCKKGEKVGRPIYKKWKTMKMAKIGGFKHMKVQRWTTFFAGFWRR